MYRRCFFALFSVPVSPAWASLSILTFACRKHSGWFFSAEYLIYRFIKLTLIFQEINGAAAWSEPWLQDRRVLYVITWTEILFIEQIAVRITKTFRLQHIVKFIFVCAKFCTLSCDSRQMKRVVDGSYRCKISPDRHCSNKIDMLSAQCIYNSLFIRNVYDNTFISMF